jgi:site-specific DNA-cytosine methylase
MKKEFLQVISQQVSECYPEITFGIEPIFINSSLLSAQSRQRYYWTNIPGIQEPEDKGIVLRDILEDNYDSDRDKSYCIDANYSKTGAKPHHYKDKYRRQLVNKPIKVGMNVEEVKVRKHEVNISGLQHLLREMKKESGKTNKQIAKETNMPVTKVEHWFRTDSSFAIPGDNIWLKLKEVLGIKTEVFDQEVMEFVYRDGVYETKQRVYSDEGKSPTITASNTEQYIETKPKMVGKTDTPGHDILKRVYSEDGKSPTITAHAGKGTVPKIETKPKQVGVAVDINGHDILKRVYSPDGKSPTVNTCQGGNREPKVVTGGAIRGRAYDNKGKRMDRDGSSVANKTTQMLELRKDNKSNAITTVGKDSIVVENLPDKSQTIKSQYYKSSRANFERQGTFHATGVQSEDLTWRKLSCRECERLQTVPDDYTNHVSNTQRYKMLGNGWTVAVIKHIFKNMDYESN